MPYKIILTANARLDVQDAIDWENSKAQGLGEKFYKVLDKKLFDLSITPAMGSLRYLNVRITFTPTFSYNIHYIIDKEIQTIDILRILNSKRKPIY